MRMQNNARLSAQTIRWGNMRMAYPIRAYGALIALICLICATGCGGLMKRVTSVVGIERETTSQVKSAPQPSPELMEQTRQMVAYGQDVLDCVWAKGAEAGDLAVRQAGDGLDWAISALMPPIRRIPLKFSDVGQLLPNVNVDKVLKDGERLLAKQRKKEDAHRKHIDEMSRKPQKTSLHLTSGLLWMYLAFGVGGVGTALAVVLGLLKRVWKKAVLQLVPGIQMFLSNGSPTAAEDLKDELRNTTDKGTRTLIDKIKREAGK